MAVVNNYENVVARSSSGEIRNSPTYKRTFTVRCDSPDTSMVDIANAPGISYGDPHPHDASCFVTNVDVDADGDSMLIYTVSYSYTRPVNDLSVTGGTPTPSGGGGGSGNTPPDPLQIPEGYWTGGSGIESRNSPVTQGWGANPGVVIRMTNGRPYTSGVVVDYATEQISMTNYYSDWGSVAKLSNAVDALNNDTWPVGYDTDTYGPMAWKVISVNWSFKQQVSQQNRLEYYEVQVTLQRKERQAYTDGIHIRVGWPGVAIAQNVIPGWLPQIPSAGYQENDGTGKLIDIVKDVQYYECDGSKMDPPEDDTPGCQQYPRKEPVTEEMPLDKDGFAVRPGNTNCAIIVPWTERYPDTLFADLFGNGPPYAPKKGPL